MSTLKNRSIKISAPYAVAGRQQKVRVLPGNKPPKMRFKPGQRVKYEGEDHVVLYAYRVRDQPHEWIYCVEEIRTDPKTRLTEAVDACARFMGLGESTPRVTYDLFMDHGEASKYFWDIPCEGPSRSNVPNKTLLKENPTK